MLERACRPGDGIRTLAPAERKSLASRYDEAASRGRASKLVPASGAATRMFQDLLSLVEEEPFPDRPTLERRARQGDAPALALEQLQERLGDLPFAPELEASLAGHGIVLGELLESHDLRPLLSHLLTAEGLELAARPKGLIPFHRYGDETATPIAEHLAEGAAYLADQDGLCRLHFTVSPDHRQAFSTETTAAGARLGPVLGMSFDTGFSVQDPATDTLAATPEGEPFRDDDGSLLLRPGGHGALLGNLAALGGDVVFLKNIDNVLPRHAHLEVAEWQRALGGLLVSLEARCHELITRLESGEAVAGEALEILGTELSDPGASSIAGGSTEEARRRLLERLRRPLRVCGVVRNQGEPGGGPYWVRSGDGGISLQVVERAEVPDLPGQAEIFAQATHFNPVQIVCAVRDERGRPFDLARFAEPTAVLIAEKTHQGRPLLALERPGLWNGAMARWHTLFVEIPSELFAPVKTVFDLLRPAHRTP